MELLDAYIAWRREVKLNSDHTINHSLTPILKACSYASELDLIDKALNARIQDMRISPKISLSTDESEFDGKSLTKEEMKYHITISMDGRGRAKDNIWIERFWKTLKTEYVYLNPADSVIDLRKGLKWYIDEYYNRQRHHSNIGGLTPWAKFSTVA